MIAAKVPSNPKSIWEAQKTKLKVKFPQVTDAELNFDETKKHEMLANLQLKLGRTSKELQTIIETL